MRGWRQREKRLLPSRNAHLMKRILSVFGRLLKLDKAKSFICEQRS